MRLQMVNRAQAAAAAAAANAGVPLPHQPPPGSVFPGQMSQHPMHQQFQQMRVPQQVPYGMMQGPMGMMRLPPRMVRTPVLGGQVYERLQTQMEKEVSIHFNRKKGCLRTALYVSLA